MFNRSRINQTNQLPVNQPNSSFGFLCAYFIKIRHTLERAGSFIFKRLALGVLRNAICFTKLMGSAELLTPFQKSADSKTRKMKANGDTNFFNVRSKTVAGKNPAEQVYSKPHFNFWYLHQYLIIIFLLLPSLLYAESGKASFYGAGEKLNKHTANREVFNPNALTAATYNYPFDTMLKVTNLENKKFVIVRVNDRGPNKRLGRAIDLTRQAFSQIASLDKGIIEVKIEKVN